MSSLYKELSDLLTTNLASQSRILHIMLCRYSFLYFGRKRTVPVQRCAVRIILGKNYTTYEESLKKINLESLETRRARLCNKFAKNCLQNDKTKNMFPLNLKKHNMEARNSEKFKVTFARTDRLKDSSIIYMQKELNKSELSQKRKPGCLYILCCFVCEL